MRSSRRTAASENMSCPFDPEAGSRLVGVPSSQHLQRGLQEDRKVELQAPIVDIPEIMIDAPLDMIHGRRRSAATMDLCQAGYSRLHAPSEGVVSHNCVELIIVRNRMRAGTDQRHAATKHVKQLRQLVDARPAQPPSDPSDPVVKASRLDRRKAIFLDRHCAEFAYPEAAPVEAEAVLPEQHRAFGVELYCDGNRDQQGRKNDQSDARSDHVDTALGSVLHLAKWAALQFHANGIAEIAAGTMKNL